MKHNHFITKYTDEFLKIGEFLLISSQDKNSLTKKKKQTKKTIACNEIYTSEMQTVCAFHNSH